MATGIKPAKKVAAKKTPAKKVAAKKTAAKKVAAKKAIAKKVATKPKTVLKESPKFKDLTGKDRIVFLLENMVRRFEANYDLLKIAPVNISHCEGTGRLAYNFKENTLKPANPYVQDRISFPQISIVLVEEPTTRSIHVSSYQRPQGLNYNEFTSGVYEFNSPRVLYGIHIYANSQNWDSIRGINFSIAAVNSKGQLIENFFPHVYHNRSICMSTYLPNLISGKLEPKMFFEGILAILNSYWSEGFRYSVDHLASRKAFADAVGINTVKLSLMELFVKTLNKDIDFDKFPVQTKTGKTTLNQIAVEFPVKPSFKNAYTQIASM